MQSIKEKDDGGDQSSYIKQIENYLQTEEERYQSYLSGDIIS